MTETLAGGAGPWLAWSGYQLDPTAAANVTVAEFSAAAPLTLQACG